MLSLVWFFVTVTHQVPLSMGILQTRIQEKVAMSSSWWSSHSRDQSQFFCISRQIIYHLSHKGSPRILEWVGSLFLFQGIFPNQESNWGLLHYRWILYQLSYQRSPESYSLNPKIYFACETTEAWRAEASCQQVDDRNGSYSYMFAYYSRKMENWGNLGVNSFK